MPEWFNRYAEIEERVGSNGYWAKRKTKYGWKLVKAGRCPKYVKGFDVVQAIGPQTEKRRKLLEKRKNNG